MAAGRKFLGRGFLGISQQSTRPAGRKFLRKWNEDSVYIVFNNSNNSAHLEHLNLSGIDMWNGKWIHSDDIKILQPLQFKIIKITEKLKNLEE